MARRFIGIALLLSLVALQEPARAQQADSAPPDSSTNQAPEQAPTTPQPEIDARFASPRASMRTFIGAVTRIASRDTSQERRSRAVRDLIRLFGLEANQTQFARDSAGRLIFILNRIGEIDETELPDKAEVDARQLTSFRFFPLERDLVTLRRRRAENQLLNAYDSGEITFERSSDGTWRFSDETVAELEPFHSAVQGIDEVVRDGVDATRISSSLWLEQYLPQELVRYRFLGVQYWKWIGLLISIFTAVLLDFLVRGILFLIFRNIARRRGADLDRSSLRRTVRPLGLIAGAAVFALGVRVLGLPVLPQTILLVAARAVFTLGAVFAAFRLTDLVSEFFTRKADLTRTKIDDLLVPLLRKTVKLFVAALGVVYLANALNIEIVPLLTGLGIGGLAVAFAAKDTIENFFGSVAVILDRPFDVGDWVQIGDVEGTVETMGLRSTRVRTFYNSLVTVPNASLVRSNVDNYGRRKYRRLRTHICITYDTPPDTIEAFCEGIRELVRQHPFTRKDYYNVWLHQMGAASLDILLYVFHEAPDWTTELRERQRLLLDIMRLAEQMGISFAFPTQTLYLRDEKDWSHMAPPEGLEQETKAKQAGRVMARQIVRQKEWRGHPPEPFAFSGTDPIDDDATDDDSGEPVVDDRTAGS